MSKRIELRPTDELWELLDSAERSGKDNLAARIERELWRRPDPDAGPAYDSPSLQDQGWQLTSYAS